MLLQAEELGDLAPDSDAEDETAEQQQPEEDPEAGVRHPRRTLVLDLRVAPRAVEMVRAVDGRRIERRRLSACTRPLAASGLCHGPIVSRRPYFQQVKGGSQRLRTLARPH